MLEYLIKYEPVNIAGILIDKYNIYFYKNSILDINVIPQFYGNDLSTPVTDVPINYTKHIDSL